MVWYGMSSVARVWVEGGRGVFPALQKDDDDGCWVMSLRGVATLIAFLGSPQLVIGW